MVDLAEQKLVSLNELCEQLSISVATGRNWLKLGKIEPSTAIDNAFYFTQDYVLNLKNSIVAGDNSSLKSRRNKKFVSGNDLYSSYVSKTSENLAIVQNILLAIKEHEIETNSEIISTIISYFARQIITQDCEFLVQDIVKNFGYLQDFVDMYPDIFDEKLKKEPNEDVLGLLYISLKNLGDRKSKGAYYTPTTIVKKLIESAFENVDCAKKSVLDPCCGTGNFILQLPKMFSCENVFASDIDLMSVLIARINFAMKFNVSDRNLIYSNVYQCDYLNKSIDRKFDYIIGNPPWGVDFSAEEKLFLQKKYITASGSNVESYDVVVEQALLDLNYNGVLAFVLPEAFLNVKAHAQVREFLMRENSISSVEYLGEVFDGVQCPSIIVQVLHNKKPLTTVGMRVKASDREFVINTNREVFADCFSFLIDDKEYALLDKISNNSSTVTLKNKAQFVLGIVTGNNSKYVSTVKTSANEPVLKGSDINKFRYSDPKNYIVFEPKAFQQVASTDLYRAKEKLVYKFISNKLVFAYDNKQTLSLNSCNILIPNIDNLSFKYILAVLNSSVAQFYFSKQFNSIKVLRSHIEQIPIPIVDKPIQLEFETLVDKILHSSEDNYRNLCDELDKKIAYLYGLTDEEFLRIRA